MVDRIFTRDEIKNLYDGIASTYDQSLFLFKIFGFRVQNYRKQAIENLNLNSGNTVVDLGCGTGLNFSLLQEKIGPEGEIIGVDLSSKMLDKAKNRAKKNGWENVELIQSDMAEFQIPMDTEGVLSTMAITMSADYDNIIKKTSESLYGGKRMSIFEIQKPKGWPDWLVNAMVKVLSPYGTRYEHTQRTPCDSIKKHFQKISIQNHYFGAVCIAVGYNSK